jgi:hypothetical protein
MLKQQLLLLHAHNPNQTGDAGFKRAILRTGEYLLRLQLSDYR